MVIVLLNCLLSITVSVLYDIVMPFSTLSEFWKYVQGLVHYIQQNKVMDVTIYTYVCHNIHYFCVVTVEQIL